MKEELKIFCWCNSGKNIKDCHHNETITKPLTFSEMQKARKKIWSKKYCLHPQKEDCNGGIIKAHTVQKAMLKHISVDSHVYTPSSKNTPNSPPEIYMKRIGIGDASVFTGFCGYHDKEIFKKIEDEDFLGTEEQCFLYIYRAVCRELFLKIAHIEDVEFNMKSIIRDSFEKQIATQKFLEEYLVGVKTGALEIQNLKKKLDNIFLSKTFDEIHYCIFWIDRSPELLCNGGFQPDFDLFGNYLQDWEDIGNELDGITMSFITNSKGGAVILGWHQSADSTCLPLVESLLAFPEERIPDLLVNWVIKDIENIFFSPIWWENLHPINQQIVLEEFMDNPSLIRERYSSYITDGRIQGFDWKITDITSNTFSIVNLL